MSLKKILIESEQDAWTNLSEDIIDFLDEEGYIYRYLDEGTEGYIFELLNKDKLIKVVPHDSPSKVYEIIEGKDIPNVMKVFFYKRFQDGYVIVMERLNPIGETDDNALDAIEHISMAETTSLVEEHENIINLIENGDLNPEVLEIYDQLAKGVLELKKMGIDYKDVWWRNVAQDDKGEYYLIDLDSSRVYA